VKARLSQKKPSFEDVTPIHHRSNQKITEKSKSRSPSHLPDYSNPE
jgi:hypothetical protein